MSCKPTALIDPALSQQRSGSWGAGWASELFPQPLVEAPLTLPGFQPGRNSDETSVWLGLGCSEAAKIDNNWCLEYLAGFVELSTLVEPTGIAETTAGSGTLD